MAQRPANCAIIRRTPEPTVTHQIAAMAMHLFGPAPLGETR